jgi:hypothetical protein
VPRVIVMMMKLVVSTGETEVLGENLPRRNFIHHKSHLPDPDANPGRRGGKPATNRFSYGAPRITIPSISPISILILSTHLRVGLPSGLFPYGFPINVLYAFLFSIRATCPAHVAKFGEKRNSCVCRILFSQGGAQGNIL